MEPLNYALDDLDLELPPIAGGDETAEVSESAGDAPAGDESGVDNTGEQDQQQEGEGQFGDQQQLDENGQRVDANGQPIGPGGAVGDAQQNGQMVPYSRFKEINDRLRARDQEFTTLLQRLGPTGEGQQNGRQQAPEMPEQYRELDKGMGGYMRHYLDPIAQHVISMKQGYDQQIADFRDESRFYRGAGRSLNEQQSQLVEQTREALSQRLRQPVERSDALMFLRGHPEHGKHFVNQQQQQQQELTRGVVAATRQAGQLGRRGTVARGRGDAGTVDLNAMPRAQRIAHFERVMGSTPV